MNEKREIGTNTMYSINIVTLLLVALGVAALVVSCEKNDKNNEFEETKIYLDKGFIKKSFFSEAGYRYEQWVKEDSEADTNKDE